MLQLPQTMPRILSLSRTAQRLFVLPDMPRPNRMLNPTLTRLQSKMLRAYASPSPNTHTPTVFVELRPLWTYRACVSE